MEILRLTPLAIRKAKELLEGEKVKSPEADNAGLRVSVTGGGCSGLQYALSFKNANPNDFTHEYENGLKIFVEEKSAPFLAGATMDYHETLEKSGFDIQNPNSNSSCGCGKSFS